MLKVSEKNRTVEFGELYIQTVQNTRKGYNGKDCSHKTDPVCLIVMALGHVLSILWVASWRVGHQRRFIPLREHLKILRVNIFRRTACGSIVDTEWQTRQTRRLWVSQFFLMSKSRKQFIRSVLARLPNFYVKEYWNVKRLTTLYASDMSSSNQFGMHAHTPIHG